MVQEIITYMIIGAAVALAILKAVNKTRAKKSHEKKVDVQNDSVMLQHNCSDCSAECMLRNTANPVIDKNQELCKKIEMKQKS